MLRYIRLRHLQLVAQTFCLFLIQINVTRKTIRQYCYTAVYFYSVYYLIKRFQTIRGKNDV